MVEKVIKLVVGLGNPGQKYQQTRHNVGFLFLDSVLDDFVGEWSRDVRFEGFVSTCVVQGAKVDLLKPDTFMNRSGNSVGKLVRYYKLSTEEILVVHDELDFEVGVAKLKKGGGHAGHNGLRDIIAHLGGNDFYRLRIGIGRPQVGKSVADYVLSRPSAEEVGLLERVFEFCKAPLLDMLRGDFEKAARELNTLKLAN